MTYVRSRFQHPSASPNSLGYTLRDYEGSRRHDVPVADMILFQRRLCARATSCLLSRIA